MLKIGDKLICMCDDNIDLTKHKIYVIINFEISLESIILKNDKNQSVRFTMFPDEYNLSYKNWFCDFKEYRKQKLKKLCLNQETE